MHFAGCVLPPARTGFSLPSPRRLRQREMLCAAVCCEHWRGGRSQGLQRPRGTPCQAAGIVTRLIICLFRCPSVRRKTKQKMGGRRMSKRTLALWHCSKPHDKGNGLHAGTQSSPAPGDSRVAGTGHRARGSSCAWVPPGDLTSPPGWEAASHYSSSERN